jgi:hypothetical protein
MDRRGAYRLRRSLACGIEVAGRRHAGTVVDLSRRGLRVETAAPLAAGSEVAVRLRRTDWSEPVTLRACHVRSHPSAPVAAGRGGTTLGLIGLRLVEAPPLYGSIFDYGVVDAGGELAPVEEARTTSSVPEPAGDDLPHIRVLPRESCRACRRSDRPVWAGLCHWCTER